MDLRRLEVSLDDKSQEMRRKEFAERLTLGGPFGWNTRRIPDARESLAERAHRLFQGFGDLYSARGGPGWLTVLLSERGDEHLGRGRLMANLAGRCAETGGEVYGVRFGFLTDDKRQRNVPLGSESYNSRDITNRVHMAGGSDHPNTSETLAEVDLTLAQGEETLGMLTAAASDPELNPDIAATAAELQLFNKDSAS